MISSHFCCNTFRCISDQYLIFRHSVVKVVLTLEFFFPKQVFEYFPVDPNVQLFGGTHIHQNHVAHSHIKRQTCTFHYYYRYYCYHQHYHNYYLYLLKLALFHADPFMCAFLTKILNISSKSATDMIVKALSVFFKSKPKSAYAAVFFSF